MSMDKEAIRKALDEATPGPWKKCGHNGIIHIKVADDSKRGIADIIMRPADACLIANAPEWLRELVAEDDRKAGEIESLREERDSWRRVAETLEREKLEARRERDEWEKAYNRKALRCLEAEAEVESLRSRLAEKEKVLEMIVSGDFIYPHERNDAIRTILSRYNEAPNG